MIRVSVGVVGLKGAVFLNGLLARGIRPSRVVAYEQTSDKSASFSSIASTARNLDIHMEVTRRIAPTSDDGVLFLVGWQYLIQHLDPRIVIFHDSLLPRYRGFAPTVAALINGEPQIGVTALKLAVDVDAGPIVGQRAFSVDYPMPIARALERQASAMAEIAADLLATLKAGLPDGMPQNEADATYSLWRDAQDFVIDWTWDAARIARFVAAVGFPYEGARTHLEGRDVVIEAVTELPDLRFEHRDVGKVWRLDNGRPCVVCGRGLLRVDSMLEVDGKAASVTRLRARFGRGR